MFALVEGGIAPVAQRMREILGLHGTIVPRGLVQAYREARYEVLADPPIDLFIDQHSDALAALMARIGVSTAAMITAWNPLSELTADEVNRAAQTALIAALDAGGWAHLAAFGHDPDGAWPGEESRLVLGIPDEPLFALGRRFGQNAVIRVRADAVPVLVMLR